ncbi:hypothetical protein AB0K38_28175 [Streptomyces griseoincarnatus]|uniref:hypothetical protein n=1 Tax=Streptomyces sp. E1N211 TaxID=1851876 RepID=UPI000E0BE44F|nr:hypothetical protein [Streptomyces sp. E1N211]AXI88085.1 hypothetical protein SAM9427_21500 [Streptomyces sp. ETH9427]
MSSTFWPIIDIEYVDSYAWVIIPPRSGPSAPFEEWDDIKSWCLERAEDLWADRELDPGPNGVEFVGETLSRCAEAFCPPGSDHWLFLHLDHPTDVPLPVCAAIGPAREPRYPTLRALTEADDQNSVEPPVVKPFHSEYLGEGMTTFRYVPQEGSPHVLACVRYAWQVTEHEADVVVWTASEDVARIMHAAPDLEELARTLAIFIP